MSFSLRKFLMRYFLPRAFLPRFFGHGYAKHHNIVLHNKKIIYFYIPKNACTTLKKLCAGQMQTGGSLSREVRDNIARNAVHKAPYPYIPFYLLDRYNDYFRFAFVRNPWDRVVSFYAQKIDQDPPTEYLSKYLVQRGFYARMPFEECVRLISKTGDDDADVHFRSQHTFIVDKQGRLMPGFIGRLESFEEDLLLLSQKCALSIDGLSHMNKSQRPHYHRMYTPVTRDLVAERYARDIKLFEYQY